MKKYFKITALVTALLMVTALIIGCGPQKMMDDPDKTYIEVQVYDGGFGYGWVEAAGRRFNEIYPDVVIRVHPEFEEGVNVYQRIALESNDLYLCDGTRNYFDFVDNELLVDITDIVTENIAGQNHSIVDTLREDLKEYYGVEEADGKHFYAIPFGTGFGGLIYDAEFFFNKGLYLTKEYDESGNEGVVDNYVISYVTSKNTDGEYASLVKEGENYYYKTNNNEILSMGPDGTYGTYDDGLPSTYKEFFELCRYMNDVENIKPFLYAGKYVAGYIKYLYNALQANYEGYDQMLRMFDFNGTLTNLISVNSNEVITQLEDVTLDPDNTNGNNIKIKQTAGNYYALKFIKQMFTDDGEWLGRNCLNASDHYTAQESFMLTKRDISNGGAFLLDGIWWEYEARETFADLATQYGDSYKKENRMFKQLPIPKINKEAVNEQQNMVSLDHLFQAAFIIKKDDMSKVEITKKFLQFMMTDESHREFTTLSGIPRPYDYDLSQEQYNSLTTYQKNLWDMTRGDKSVVYPVSKSSYYRNKFDSLSPTIFNTTISGFNYTNMVEALKTKDFSAKQVFDGLMTFATQKGL